MPGASRVGVDSASSLIVENLAPTVIVNGAPVAVKGAKEARRHQLDESSSTVFANGIPIVRAGDLDSNRKPASGSSDVIVG